MVDFAVLPRLPEFPFLRTGAPLAGFQRFFIGSSIIAPFSIRQSGFSRQRISFKMFDKTVQLGPVLLDFRFACKAL